MAPEADAQQPPDDSRRRLVFGPWHGLLRSFVHLPALAMTSIIMWAHYTKAFWFDEGGVSGVSSANNILNALQILAKIYELAIVASLAHITVKIFKRALIGGGLPVSMLTGGYRVGDLFFLAGSHFRVGMRGALLLAWFLALSTVLAVLAGPASAILIIPELGWFPVRQPFIPGAMPVLLPPPEGNWPKILFDGGFLNTTLCSQEMANFRLECPSAGFAPLYNWAAGWSTAGLPDSIPFPDHTGRTTRRLDLHTDNDTGTFATLPMSFVASAAGQLQILLESRNMGPVSDISKYKLDLKTDETMPIWQPLVQAKCFVWNLERPMDTANNLDTNQTMGPGPDFNCYSANQTSTCHRTRKVLGEHLRRHFRPIRDNKTHVASTSWVNPPGAGDFDDEGFPLTSFLFAARLPFTTEDSYGNKTLGVRSVRCGTMSHWIPTTFSLDPSNTDRVETNITDVSIFAKEAGYRTATGGGELDRMIHIADSWVPFINPRYNVSRQVPASEGDGQQSNDTTSTYVTRIARMVALMNAFMSQPDPLDEVGPYAGQYFGPGSGRDAMEMSSDEEVRRTAERFVAAVLADAISRNRAVVEPGPLMFLPSSRGEGALTLLNLRYINPRAARRFWNELTLFPNGTIVDAAGDVLDGTGSGAAQFLRDRHRNLTRLDFDARRYGYGYGHVGGTTTFAFVVIYAYLATLLSYMVVVAVTGSHAVDAWGDLQDLVALAWSSPSPPELVGNGSGVKSRLFWRKPVAIRASASGAVTMGVADDQGGLRRLKRREKYR